MNITKLVPKIIKPYLPQVFLDWIERKSQQEDFATWEKEGKPMPPPHIIKQQIIKAYQEKYGYQTLVETGTFMGAMVQAQKKNFKNIFSIELSPQLYKKAAKRFKGDAHVMLFEGDSSTKLYEVMKHFNEPVIFWLDGHYSLGMTAKGEKACPVYEELDAIFSSMPYNHILLIDDARCFETSQMDYPSVENLTRHIHSKNASYQLEIKDDVLRYTV